MEIDFSKCEIRTPREPAELRRLYEMLAEVFPVEKKLFEDIMSGKHTLYKWEPHTLYQGDEPLGNVSIVMFQLQSGGRLQKTAGIASVATPERYRGMGVAKHLMGHVLKAIDAQNLPSILFTSLPKVYSGLGYQAVDQGVKQTEAKVFYRRTDGLDIHRLTRLTRKDLETAEGLYKALLPYDGKLCRDREYWHRYGSSVNNSGKCEFAFCRRGDKTVGYARLEYESDRVLLDEFYAPSESREIIAALWNWASAAAEKKDLRLISVALPQNHSLWNFLQNNNMAVEPESGTGREVFMVRMPKRENIKWLADLRWSLSDKF